MGEEDFTGLMKPIIDACLSGTKFNDGKIRLAKGEVYESWNKGGNQFFILKLVGGYFMGVDLGLFSNDGLCLIANEVEREINCRYRNDFPGPGLIVKKIVIRREKDEECLSFMFNLSLLKDDNFCNREKNPEIEKKLDEALEEFKKRYFALSPK